MKPKFKLEVDTELDDVILVKSKILMKLGLDKNDDEWEHTLKKVRLFCLKGGTELMDNDLMQSIENLEYLFYSLGKYYPQNDKIIFHQI